MELPRNSGAVPAREETSGTAKKPLTLLLIIFSLIVFSYKAAAVFKGGVVGEEQGKLGIGILPPITSVLTVFFHTGYAG